MAKTGTRSADAVDRLVGRRIAARRMALGLSQTALGAQAGVSFQQLQKYEAGLNRVSASRLHRIATLLGASAADFFPDETDDHPPSARSAPALSPEAAALGAAFERIPAAPVRRAVIRIVAALAA